MQFIWWLAVNVQDFGARVQHVRSRKSRADENAHEIYIEIESRGDDVVEHLKKRMRSDVKVHVISAGNNVYFDTLIFRSSCTWDHPLLFAYVVE